MRYYFYQKQNKKIEPVIDSSLNEKARQKLNNIYKQRECYRLPSYILENWSNVSLYDPKGNLDTAESLLVNPQNGAYHLRNKLNHLTGKEWVKFSCSWFIFNAIKEDLDAEKELDPKIEEHPATFSPTMISTFINFFTKEGDSVIDPFCGIGTTLEACKRTGRVGYGVELNKKYYKLCLKRTPEFKDNIFHHDSCKINEIKLPKIDFCITSPPYWNILNRSTHTFKTERTKKNLDINYSNFTDDLGNIKQYDVFLEKLSKVFFDLNKILKKNAYIVIIVKNLKKSGKLYPLAWDIANILREKYELKDEKIWIQDKASLAPFGYPFSWASNILHHYCIILRKENE